MQGSHAFDHLQKVCGVLLGFGDQGWVETFPGEMRQVVGELVDRRLFVRIEIRLIKLAIE